MGGLKWEILSGRFEMGGNIGNTLLKAHFNFMDFKWEVILGVLRAPILWF